MSKILETLKNKNCTYNSYNVKVNDSVTIKRISGEFKNNVITINGICTKVTHSNNGTRITLKTFLYDEVVFQSFLINSPSILKLNIN
jgi:ribosomal protein L19